MCYKTGQVYLLTTSLSPPTVLTQAEVQRLLTAMKGKTALMAKLLYGSGLRLMECIRLRVQDVDFVQNLIFIRGGKGGKYRTVPLRTVPLRCL